MQLVQLNLIKIMKLDKYVVRFKHFKSKQEYIELQRDFLGFDYKKEFFQEVEIDDYKDLRVIKLENPLSNPAIIVYSRNSENEDKYEEIKFEEDFVIPKIENIAAPAFESFKKSIRHKGLYTDELVKGLALDWQDKINSIRDNIENADYLNDQIYKILSKELDRLEDMINAYIINPLPAVKEKIPINWSRTDVIYFFHLLRSNKVIGSIREADLGRLIDNAFQYYDEKEKNYRDIKNSKKHLNAFWNDEGRPDSATNERLRSIFQDDDFFNI